MFLLEAIGVGSKMMKISFFEEEGDEIPRAHIKTLSSPSSWEVVSVMMTNTSTMEEKMAEMEHRVVLLTKALEDKDLQIVTLMNKLEVQDL